MNDLLLDDPPELETRKTNRSFSKQIPTLQLAYDQTSIGERKLCAQKYKYSIIDGYEPIEDNVHFIFGGEAHHAFEHFDHLRSKGLDVKRATTAVLQDTLQRTWRKDLNRPWPSDNPNKNRETLLRTIAWYIREFQDDPLETIILEDGSPAVELLFSFEIGVKSRLTGEPFLLCGRIDKLVRYEGRPIITDKKTTKFQLNHAYFNRFTPDNQVSAYMIAGGFILNEEVLTMMIDAIQVLVNSTRFQRGIVYRSPLQLDEWMRDLYILLEENERSVERGIFPRNDKACGIPHLDPKTGEVRHGCPFREVCSAGNEELRETLLQANFNRRVWDPITPRKFEINPGGTTE